MKTTITKKHVSLLLVLAIMLSVFAGAFAANNNKATFTDVPANHWAYSYVERAAANGWVNGVGNGRFGVNNSITYAQFVTILDRVFLADTLESNSNVTGDWYAPYWVTAQSEGLFTGTKADVGTTTVANDPSLQYANQATTRYEMAQMLRNVLVGKSVQLDYNAADVQSGIADWSSVPEGYRDALTAVVGTGIINGVDQQGTFAGSKTMTRGQAATVICRIVDLVDAKGKDGWTNPKDAGTTTDPEPTNPPTTGLLKNGKPATVENVVEMLKEIEKQYPTGMVWTDIAKDPNTNYNPNPVSKAVDQIIGARYATDTKYACGGFAAMVSDLIFPEDMKLREVTDLSKVRPGDIVFDVSRDGKRVSHVWIALSESTLGRSGYWAYPMLMEIPTPKFIGDGNFTAQFGVRTRFLGGDIV